MLTESKKVQNNIFDIILTEALREDCEREVTIFSDGEEHIFNEKFEKNITIIAKRLKRKQNVIKLKKATPKIATVAAVIICVALATNPSVSAFFKGIITKIIGEYNQYEFIDDIDITIDNFNSELRPYYLPEGYRITDVHYGLANMSIDYTDNDNGIIAIKYGSANYGEIGVDNENSTVHTVLINGNEAIFHKTIAEDRPSYLIWKDGGYAFVISAQLDLEKFVKIAESIKIS